MTRGLGILIVVALSSLAVPTEATDAYCTRPADLICVQPHNMTTLRFTPDIPSYFVSVYETLSLVPCVKLMGAVYDEENQIYYGGDTIIDGCLGLAAEFVTEIPVAQARTAPDPGAAAYFGFARVGNSQIPTSLWPSIPIVCPDIDCSNLAAIE